MNVFFVMNDGSVVTPPLGGTILPGITRASVIVLAEERGLRVERFHRLFERRLAVPFMHLVQVDDIGLQAFEARFAFPDQVVARQSLVVRAVTHAPLVYLALRAGLMTLPRDGVEAARLSGASSLRVFRDIILPLSLPGIIAGAAISFVSCTGNFGIPAILGIPASIFTLPTLIFTKFSAFTSRTFGDVAVLSGIIAMISVAGLMIQDRALRGRDYRIIGLSGASAAFELGAWRFAFTPLLWAILFFMLVAEDKEIAGAVAIRSADPKAYPYNISMLPVISWYFGKADA